MHDDSSGGTEKPKRRGSYVGESYQPTPGTPYRERGGCLTAFLIFVIALYVFSLFALCAKYNEATSNKGMLMLSWVIQAALLASAVALWKWKIWGFFGLLAGYVLAMAIGLYTMNFVSLIVEFVGLVILCSLVTPKLEMLE